MVYILFLTIDGQLKTCSFRQVLSFEFGESFRQSMLLIHHCKNIPILTTKWIQSYRCARTIQVKLGNPIAKPKAILSGVPLKSSLDLNIFNIFTNDIHNQPKEQFNLQCMHKILLFHQKPNPHPKLTIYSSTITNKIYKNIAQSFVQEPSKPIMLLLVSLIPKYFGAIMVSKINFNKHIQRIKIKISVRFRWTHRTTSIESLHTSLSSHMHPQ